MGRLCRALRRTYLSCGLSGAAHQFSASGRQSAGQGNSLMAAFAAIAVAEDKDFVL